MRSNLYRWLLQSIIPYIRFTTYYPSLRGWKYQRGYNLLQPGDIILTVDRRKLTTVLIGGEFSHAAQCVGKNVEWEISEMTHHDYTMSTFFDICKEADRVVILRCTDYDADYIQKVIERCKELRTAKYDQTFSLGVDFLYCSELNYQSDVERRLQVNLEDLAGIGRPYISPTGLYKAKNVQIVWDSDLEIAGIGQF